MIESMTRAKKPLSILEQVRKQLTILGKSEMAAREDQSALRDLFAKRQALIEERNEAKKAASAKAAEPYDDAIERLEKTYAMFIKLSST